MKTILPIFLFVIASSVSYASDWSYNYLSKLYKKSPTTCFKRSEAMMNLFPKQESPYYFAMRVKTDEVFTAKTAKLRYTRIVKAFEYAKYFEKNASDELKTKVTWDTITPYLFELAGDVRENLSAEHLSSSVRQLDEKWKTFAGTSLKPEKEEDPVAVETIVQKENNETASISETATKTTNYTVASFNGMPKGTENIASYNPTSEKELLILINKERKQLKMDTLVWNADLARACRYHAMDMGTQSYFDHNSFDLINGKPKEIGETFDRIRSFYSSTFVNSENIAAGNEGADGTYSQWFHSPGHYDNMFNAESKKVGIGVVYVPNSEYGYYWVFCTAL